MHDATDRSRDRFRRADAIFDAALDIAPGDRAAFVDRACGDDPELRDDVERLLRAHAKSEAFLGTPATDFVAPLLRHALEATSDEAPCPSTPSRIGPYRIEREIGRGGMGVVYLAERDDPTFRQRVALKVMRGAQSDGGTSIARFLAERQLLVSLEHPHIARLFDGGVTTDGLPYYTMAYCEGGSLADRLRARGALAVPEALRITRELAEALGAAHARGVVHRDVKPANVLFDADGAVRLSDFGVAKLLGADATTSATMHGTVAYLAPEQVRGEAVDHRADLWALGVTLYEMIAGRRPFDGPSYAAVLHAIVATAPPPLGHDIPAGVKEVVAALLEKEPAARTPSAASLVASLDRVESGEGRRRSTGPRRRSWAAIAGPAALLTIVAGTFIWNRAPFRTTAPVTATMAATGPKSLAVMPFTNTSSEPEDEPFADGLTEELIGILGKTTSLRMTARSSVFALKGKRLDARKVADTLGVEYVLEGGVRRAGDRLRVFAELVSAQDGRVIWSDQYDRTLADVFAVQQDIAKAIAGALRVQLVAGSPPPTVDAEAYELNLKGRFALNTRSGPDDLLRAVRYFEAAIARDSNYARAYAGLSDAWALISNFGYDRPRPSFAKARAAALRALALDSTLADARASLGHTLCTEDYAWAAAERELRRAIDQDPTYAFARTTYAVCLMATGRHAEAVAQLDTARRLDPLRVGIGALLGRAYVNWGRPDEAIAALDQVIDLNPQADLAWQQLGHAYLLKQQSADAIAAFRKAAALSGLRDSAHLAYAYAVTGDRATAERIVGDLVASSSRRYVSPFHIAMAYSALGRVDDAFAFLERGYDERASFMGLVKFTVAFAPLHGDPRWSRLLARMGLEP
jgi:serine/threonine-protein kinase